MDTGLAHAVADKPASATLAEVSREAKDRMTGVKNGPFLIES